MNEPDWAEFEAELEDDPRILFRGELEAFEPEAKRGSRYTVRINRDTTVRGEFVSKPPKLSGKAVGYRWGNDRFLLETPQLAQKRRQLRDLPPALRSPTKLAEKLQQALKHAPRNNLLSQPTRIERGSQGAYPLTAPYKGKSGVTAFNATSNQGGGDSALLLANNNQWVSFGNQAGGSVRSRRDVERGAPQPKPLSIEGKVGYCYLVRIQRRANIMQAYQQVWQVYIGGFTENNILVKEIPFTTTLIPFAAIDLREDKWHVGLYWRDNLGVISAEYLRQGTAVTDVESVWQIGNVATFVTQNTPAGPAIGVGFTYLGFGLWVSPGNSPFAGEYNRYGRPYLQTTGSGSSRWAAICQVNGQVQLVLTAESVYSRELKYFDSPNYYVNGDTESDVIRSSANSPAPPGGDSFPNSYSRDFLAIRTVPPPVETRTYRDLAKGGMALRVSLDWETTLELDQEILNYFDSTNTSSIGTTTSGYSGFATLAGHTITDFAFSSAAGVVTNTENIDLLPGQSPCKTHEIQAVGGAAMISEKMLLGHWQIDNQPGVGVAYPTVPQHERVYANLFTDVYKDFITILDRESLLNRKIARYSKTTTVTWPTTGAVIAQDLADIYPELLNVNATLPDNLEHTTKTCKVYVYNPALTTILKELEVEVTPVQFGMNRADLNVGLLEPLDYIFCNASFAADNWT